MCVDETWFCEPCENLLSFFCQACWGGSVLFSKKHRHLMKGVDRY